MRKIVRIQISCEFRNRGLAYLPLADSAGHRDILMAVAALPPGNFPGFLRNMLSVNNVSMRYGAKVLFDEVSTAFTPGKRYGLSGP